ncbi:hypothetical protein VNI00_012946 [Paramarasmius palmivorus]|uniref:NACHT domain-containing protein n=1 Tax=Paramarasmius palmivorus TaxID=297713 RepID=A0AAW0C3M8_9AGAR
MPFDFPDGRIDNGANMWQPPGFHTGAATLFERSNVDISGGNFYNVAGDATISNSLDYSIYGHLRPVIAKTAIHSLDDTSPRCEPGTRVEIIQSIMQWVCNRHVTKRLLWLKGLAGEGKSAIARSIADNCARTRTTRNPFLETACGNGTIAATFFFQRTHGDRSNATQLFTTIAAQLANYSRELNDAIMQVLKDDPSIIDAGPHVQLQRLIAEPLQSHGACVRDAVIILEALDECEDSVDTLRSLIRLLANKPLFKLFFTSRSVHYIQDLVAATDPALINSLCLSDYGANADIRRFLTTSFQSIREEKAKYISDAQNWPSQEVVDRLVKASSGLFIYASSAIEFVRHDSKIPRASNPQRRLSMLFHSGSVCSPQCDPYAPLDNLYRHVLSEAENDTSHFKIVIGTVMSLFIPLSRQDLNLLISSMIESKGDVDVILDGLSSILKLAWDVNSPEPVQIYHQSLYDFLVDKRRAGKFHIEPSLRHADITRCCFDILHRHRQSNICKISPPAEYSKVMDLSERRKKYMPVALKYACLFWEKHLTMSSFTQTEIDRYLDQFFKEYFLFWVECLSLLGLLGRAVQVIDVFDGNKEHWASLEECRKFLLFFYKDIASYSDGVEKILSEKLPRRSVILEWHPCNAKSPDNSLSNHGHSVRTRMYDPVQTVVYGYGNEPYPGHYPTWMRYFGKEEITSSWLGIQRDACNQYKRSPKYDFAQAIRAATNMPMDPRFASEKDTLDHQSTGHRSYLFSPVLQGGNTIFG